MEHIAQLRRFIVENFLFGDERALHDDTSFTENRIIDSTGIVELISFIEATFGIRIEDHELVRDNLDSLKKINAFISQKLTSTAGNTGA